LCQRYESGCLVAGRAQQPGQAVALPVGQRGQGIGHLFHPLVDVVVIVAGRGVVAAWCVVIGRLGSGGAARGAFTSFPYWAWWRGPVRAGHGLAMSRVRRAEVNFAADLRCQWSRGSVSASVSKDAGPDAG
jgi:hypothetical protein